MENLLLKIDNYFDQKSQNEGMVLNFGAAAVIFAVIFLLLFTPSMDYFEESETRFNDIDTKLANTKSNIKLYSSPDGLDTNFKINQEATKLNLLKATLADLQKSNLYFDGKLSELSFLLFNEQNWADFLDNIVFLAKANNIKISRITNEFKNPGYQKVEQFLNIGLTISGNFKDLVSYINKIEESKLVVDINKLDINTTTTSSALDAKFGISVWGMKY
ncbi:type 4a pilus biogenesis protein PilO [Campylobacter gastrosuis]|uniref:Type 4a pilus biogenesis protein PilO n=1 Tax=Campylobacter gastrosuis TaxID=2974576 RepID=A0ABT7HNA8_9BACT|nr:type 4a pilus biogenesis protein PilO [Campylobacter gastrosuis]MDL0088394.1 type 4a pilus biogenesis protein PilO [Campylobacter gastrosuis]